MSELSLSSAGSPASSSAALPRARPIGHEDPDKFVDLGRPRRIWAIASIHSQPDRLRVVQGQLARRFIAGDRLVYLGNMIGWGAETGRTIDALLRFRVSLLARPGVLASDIVYLRGAQEEMWRKLLQLQLAPDPPEVLDWMLRHGLAGTLAGYGGSVEHGVLAARSGPVILGRWTQALRQTMLGQPGHDALFSALRRAAFCREGQHDGADAQKSDTPTSGVQPSGSGALFVSAGLDPRRPLHRQGDNFWWGGAALTKLDTPFGGFARVVRGYDPTHAGLLQSDYLLSLDGGSSCVPDAGIPIVCGCLGPGGEVLDLFQV